MSNSKKADQLLLSIFANDADFIDNNYQFFEDMARHCNAIETVNNEVYVIPTKFSEGLSISAAKIYTEASTNRDIDKATKNVKTCHFYLMCLTFLLEYIIPEINRTNSSKLVTEYQSTIDIMIGHTRKVQDCLIKSYGLLTELLVVDVKIAILGRSYSTD